MSDDDFCLIHGRDHMQCDKGPIPYCSACDAAIGPRFSTRWEQEDYEREKRGEKPRGPPFFQPERCEMSEDLVAMARAAEKDERLSDGALYGKLAAKIEQLEKIEAAATALVNECKGDLTPSLGVLARLEDAIHSSWKSKQEGTTP